MGSAACVQNVEPGVIVRQGPIVVLGGHLGVAFCLKVKRGLVWVRIVRVTMGHWRQRAGVVPRALARSVGTARHRGMLRLGGRALVRARVSGARRPQVDLLSRASTRVREGGHKPVRFDGH